MRSVNLPRRSLTRKVAAERRFSRTRFTVTQRPATVRRWSFTKRPLNDRAATARVLKRARPIRQNLTLGRTPIATLRLVKPFQLEM